MYPCLRRGAEVAASQRESTSETRDWNVLRAYCTSRYVYLEECVVYACLFVVVVRGGERTRDGEGEGEPEGTRGDANKVNACESVE